MKELKAGDKIYQRYGSKEIVEITEDEITTYKGGVYKIKDIRDIKVSMIDSKLDEFIKELEKIEDEYPYVIADAWHNIAVSKISKPDFQEKSKTENYSSLYNENVRLLFHSKEFKEKNKDVKGIELYPVINDFLNNMHIAFWDIITTHNLATMVSGMYLFGGKYNEEPSCIYKDTSFIKSKS